MTDEELMHFGVKGMKWGVRKGSSVKTSKDYRDVAPYTKKKAKELTNKQLEQVNKRLTLEKKYKDLNLNAIQRGQAQVAVVLGVIGTVSSIIAVANTPAGKAAIAVGKKALEKTKGGV